MDGVEAPSERLRGEFVLGAGRSAWRFSPESIVRYPEVIAFLDVHSDCDEPHRHGAVVTPGIHSPVASTTSVAADRLLSDPPVRVEALGRCRTGMRDR